MRTLSVTSLTDERVLAGVVARARSSATLERFKDQGERCGWCAHPIRLIGSSASVDIATGEIVRTYSTNDAPDGVLLKACGTWRAARCLACAATYAADARVLVRAGMAGGKGVPTTVSEHPMVFATFTAPSFGVVHGTRSNACQVCRPGNRQLLCPHGRSLTCWARHENGDAAVGEPFCFDVTTTSARSSGTRRARNCGVVRPPTYAESWLASSVSVPNSFIAKLRVSFAKVAEFQRRGVVHLHAVIRLDDRDDEVLLPNNEVTISMLTAAIHAAAQGVGTVTARLRRRTTRTGAMGRADRREGHRGWRRRERRRVPRYSSVTVKSFSSGGELRR